VGIRLSSRLWAGVCPWDSAVDMGAGEGTSPRYKRMAIPGPGRAPPFWITPNADSERRALQPGTLTRPSSIMLRRGT